MAHKRLSDELIEIDEILVLIAKHNVHPDDHAELKTIISDLAHHELLSTLLNKTPKENHQQLIHHIHNSDTQTLLDWLKIEVHKDIESELKIFGQNLKKEILSEIHQASGKKHK